MKQIYLKSVFRIIFVSVFVLNCGYANGDVSTTTTNVHAIVELKKVVDNNKSLEIFKPIVHSTNEDEEIVNKTTEVANVDSVTTTPSSASSTLRNKLHRVSLTSGSGTTDEPALSHFMVPISELDSNENKSEAIDSSSSSSGSGLPRTIIFRRDIENCPKICNQVISEEKKLSSCNRGCRYFIFSEILTSETDAELKLNRTISSCFKSCFQSYDNGTDNCDSCLTGCKKTAELTTSTDSTLNESNSELEREESITSSDDDDDVHRSISIIIPIRTIGAEEEENDGHKPDRSMPPPSVMQMMLSMMQAMQERARQMMPQQGGGDPRPKPGSSFDDNGEQSNVQESSISVDDSGNSVSVQRSMSIVVTNDQNGQRKVVVMHSMPKVTIHRNYGPADFLANRPRPQMPSQFGIPIETINNMKDLHRSESSKDKDNYFTFQNGDERIQFVADVHRPYDSEINQINHQGGKVYYRPVRPWSACLYTLLPRLFYLTMIILMIYIIFWLFCSIPSNYNRRQSDIAILATTEPSKKPKRKFFFGSSNTNKYFQLNNKASSNVSLSASNLSPPPYPGVDYFPESDNSCMPANDCSLPISDNKDDIKLVEEKPQQEQKK